MAWLTQPLFSSKPAQHLSLLPLSGAGDVAWLDHDANGDSWGSKQNWPSPSVNRQKKETLLWLKDKQCQWLHTRGDWHGAVVTWREECFFRLVTLKCAHLCWKAAALCEPEAPWSHVSGGGPCCVTVQSQLILITCLHWLPGLEKLQGGEKKEKAEKRLLQSRWIFSKLIANSQGSQGPLLVETKHQIKRWREQEDSSSSFLI